MSILTNNVDVECGSSEAELDVGRLSVPSKTGYSPRRALIRPVEQGHIHRMGSFLISNGVLLR